MEEKHRKPEPCSEGAQAQWNHHQIRSWLSEDKVLLLEEPWSQDLLTMGILHWCPDYQLDPPVPVGTKAMDGNLNPDSLELSSSFVKNVKGILIREIRSRKGGSITASGTQTSS